MASQHNYSITFMPLRAAAGAAPYVLSIGGGSGDAVPLKGGAQPFTTQESDDEDMFVPIRTQSGYLRIVDDGKDANGNAWDWKDLIPATDTSRPVTLMRGGTVVWQGFMQAQDFGSVLYGNPQEREFPVQCVLSVLGGSDINYNQTAIQNFAYLLKQIVDAIPSACRPTEFYIQGGANAQEWLLKRIDWQNFVSEDADGLTARFTMYQCLEDMCRFWGWTARTKGTAMYLTCADDSNQTTWLELTYAELEQLAAYSGAILATSVPFETASLSGDIFASTNNDEYVQRGVKKATVSVDGNAADETLIEAFPSSVENIMAHNGTYTEQYSGVSVMYSNDITGFTDSYLVGSCRSSYATFNIANAYTVGVDSSGTTSDVIRIKKTFGSASDSAFASMSTVFHHTFPGSGFNRFGVRPIGLSLCGTAYVKGKKFEDYQVSGEGRKHIYMRLGIGTSRANAKWFNGSDSWTTIENEFKVTLGNRTEEMFVEHSSGFVFIKVIPLPTTNILYGRIFVEFLGSDDMPKDDNDQRSFDIADFFIKYVTSNEGWTILGEATKDSSATYKSSNGSNMSDEWGTDCIYASQNNLARGYGLVMNPDYSYLETLVFAGSATAKHPEQHLADRVTNFWQTSRRRLAVELRRDLIADITPRHKVTIDGMTGYPIAISHEWRDDVTQLTILQL